MPPVTVNTRCGPQGSRDLCGSGRGVGHRPANHITMRAKRWPADSEIKRRGKARLILLKGKLPTHAAFTQLLQTARFSQDCVTWVSPGLRAGVGALFRPAKRWSLLSAHRLCLRRFLFKREKERKKERKATDTPTSKACCRHCLLSPFCFRMTISWIFQKHQFFQRLERQQQQKSILATSVTKRKEKCPIYLGISTRSAVLSVWSEGLGGSGCFQGLPKVLPFSAVTLYDARFSSLLPSQLQSTAGWSWWKSPAVTQRFANWKAKALRRLAKARSSISHFTECFVALENNHFGEKKFFGMSKKHFAVIFKTVNQLVPLKFPLLCFCCIKYGWMEFTIKPNQLPATQTVWALQ